jgi:hypothetical protein
LTELVELRYTGEQAVTFQFPGVGYVEPKGEFSVPPEAVLSFMRRADIEHAGGCPVPPCRCGEEPEPEPSAPQESESGTSGKPRGGRRGSGPSTQDAQD